MKKSKLLVLGLIALMLAGGLVLASCHAGCEGAGTCKITRTSDGMGFKGSGCSTSSCAIYKSGSKVGDTIKCDC